MIGLAGLIAIAFFVMFFKTKLGMYFRAIISDKVMVESLGINVKRLMSVMFPSPFARGGIAGGDQFPPDFGGAVAKRGGAGNIR